MINLILLNCEVAGNVIEGFGKATRETNNLCILEQREWVQCCWLEQLPQQLGEQLGGF